MQCGAPAGPLAGLRVLELARILAGPWAGQTFAELGADVLKIESPAGDDTRGWGPPFVANADGSRDAAYFHACNRGKRSAVVDFATPEGQATIARLAADADVLIENFKVSGLAKHGLDYAALSALNPRLIYCSITGFGQDGPNAARPGYDFIIQGLSGVMDVTGEPDRPGQKMGVAFADIFTGLYAVIAVQAALAERTKTGQGRHIDMALLDSMVGVLANQGMNFLATGTSPLRMGNVHPNIAPYEVFQAMDGDVILAVGNDAQFVRLCDVLDLGETGRSPDFGSNASRVANRGMLTQLLSARTHTWRRDALLDALHRMGVPAGPVNTIEQAMTDPQVIARNLVRSFDRPDSDPVLGIATPIRYAGEQPLSSIGAPRLGSHEATWLPMAPSEETA